MAIAISGITPATGPLSGGTVHYITGTSLDTVTGITIKGAAVAQYSALSPTLIRLTLPAGTATGAGDVVLNPGAVTLAGGFTYAAAASTEQLVSTVARKWALDVNTGTVAAPVWTPVRAIGELKPTIDSQMEDDSDYDSNGWASEVKTQLKWALETKVFRKVGVTSANYDPGQEKLRAAADQFGAAGTVQVRWYDRTGGPEAYSGFASVAWEPEGGDAKALDQVTIKLSGNGARTNITNPAA